MKTTILFASLILILAACGDNVDEFKLTSEQLRVRAESAAGDNNQIILMAEEVLNITGEVLADEGISHSRAYGRTNGRTCSPSVDHSYLIDRTHYDTILYVGTMTIDYGNGESCSNPDEMRMGKVVDNFLYILNTETGVFTSREVITFEGYKKNSLKLDGELTIRAQSGEAVTLETKQAKITYSDDTYALWEGILSFVSRDPDPHTGVASAKSISGTIEGVTRRRENFTAMITSPVEYNYDCTNGPVPVPVSGTVNLNVNEETTVVEYGNGNCDDIYIIAANGKDSEYAF